MEPNTTLPERYELIKMARSGQLRLPARLSERGRQRADRVLYPMAALLFALGAPFLAGLVAAVFVAAVVLVLGGTWPSLQEGPVLALALILGTAPLYLLVWAWLRLFERRGLASSGLVRDRVFSRYGRGLLVGFTLFGAAVTLLALSGGLVRAGGEGFSLTWPTAGLILLFFLAWMVQGGSEEVLLRGFLMPVLGARLGVGAGVILSSLTFAVVHLFNPNLNLIGMLNLFLFGLFAALYALRHGGLWGVSAVHGAWNFIQGNVFGFAVSGAELGQGALFQLAGTGPAWWTGGAFGPEGGLAVTAVLLIASALALRPRPHPAGPARGPSGGGGQ
jgi:uncharacterized protein